MTKLRRYLQAGAKFADSLDCFCILEKDYGLQAGGEPTVVKDGGRKVLNFDSADSSYFEFTDDSEIKSAIDGATEFSISIWVNVVNTNTDNAILTTDDWGTNAQLLLWMDEEGATTGNLKTLSVLVSDGSNDARVEGNNNSASENIWHHVVATFESESTSGLRLYIDGVEQDDSPVDTTDIAALKTTTSNLFIGASADLDETKFFDGRMKDLLIFDRVLTPQEVSDIYAGKAFDYDKNISNKWDMGSQYPQDLFGETTISESDINSEGVINRSSFSNAWELDGDDEIQLITPITLSNAEGYSIVWLGKQYDTANRSLFGYFDNLYRNYLRYRNVGGFQLEFDQYDFNYSLDTNSVLRDGSNLKTVCLTLNGTEGKIYENNSYSGLIEDSDGTNIAPADGTFTFDLIGRGHPDGQYYGLLDSLMIFNKPLTQLQAFDLSRRIYGDRI